MRAAAFRGCSRSFPENNKRGLWKRGRAAMRKHYERMLKDTETRARKAVRDQIREPGSRYGGIMAENGLVQARNNIYRASSAIGVYCNPDSGCFRDSDIFRMIRDGLRFAESCQHENGLFDLISCNFDSAPDTAFILKRIFPYLFYLERNRETQEEEEIYRLLRGMAEKGVKGICGGGFHTPNHRWAIASQLMQYGEYFGDDSLKEAAERYLLEGIDCSEDGEYSEKSSGNYNRINNDAMITIGNVTGNKGYYEYAVRNLRMMLTYIEPDGSIFTANSTRWDNGMVVFPKNYYSEYLEMGIVMDIPEFLDMANFIFQMAEDKGILSPDQLIVYMNHSEWIDVEHEGVWKQGNFKCLYESSGIARVRKGNYLYTLMAEKPGFLHFTGKGVSVEVKIAGGFFEHRAFQPDTLKALPDGNGYLLTQVMHGWYYLPFREKQKTSDWWEMDNKSREKLDGPDLNFEVKVLEIEDGIELQMKVTGVQGAPFRVEFAVSGADYVQGKEYQMKAWNGGSMILRSGDGFFGNGEESLRIGPGFAVHRFTAGMAGSQTEIGNRFMVYCTDLTEFERSVRIRLCEAQMI